MEHILQPRTSDLGRNHSDKHQSRVELGIDDLGIESDARQDDAGTSSRIGCEGEVDEVKLAEARQPPRK
jgi:hypothetical protein